MNILFLSQLLFLFMICIIKEKTKNAMNEILKSRNYHFFFFYQNDATIGFYENQQKNFSLCNSITFSLSYINESWIYKKLSKLRIKELYFVMQWVNVIEVMVIVMQI